MPNNFLPPEIRRPSARDVAEAAGVSISAVSRTFTPGASVSRKTRERVLAAAATLGYHPSALPRMMQTGTSGVIAFIGGGHPNPFAATALSKTLGAFAEEGKHVLLVRAGHHEQLDDVLLRMAGYQVDGIISVLPVKSDAATFVLSAAHIPIVTLDPGISCNAVHVVCSDNEGAGAMAAHHLIACGARRLAHIGGKGHPSGVMREKGFRQAVAAANLAPPHVLYSDFSYTGGFDTTLSLFARHQPDAIFCGNDLMAIGCLDALRSRLHLRVPEDVMVLGHDDIEMAEWAPYQLSTLQMNIDRGVQACVDIIMGRSTAPHTSHKPSLIQRQTTTPKKTP